MLKAKDFRRYAREALKGRWLKAGGVGLLAGFLGATICITPSYSGSSSAASSTGAAGNTDVISSVASSPDIPAMFFAVLMGIMLVFLLYAIVLIVIGGATTLGYAKYNLNLVDDKDSKLKDIFSQYNRIGTGFGMQFFRGLFVWLWSLLLFIPGIIAGYRYYMTPFILCENPNMTAREAIRESKELMKGNKWRLFCLELSFIGWELLAVGIIWVALILILTPMVLVGSSMDAIILPTVLILLVVFIAFAIALSLTLSPYIMASIAVFYREISEGRYSNPHVEGETVDDAYETYTQGPIAKGETVDDTYVAYTEKQSVEKSQDL